MGEARLSSPVPLRKLSAQIDAFLERDTSRIKDEGEEIVLPEFLRLVYGTGIGSARRGASLLKEGLAGFEAEFGEQEVCVFRAPARVNLRGMHVDNNGGFCNSICIDRETLLIFKKLDLKGPDEKAPPVPVLDLKNIDDRFEPRDLQVFPELFNDKAQGAGWAKYAWSVVQTLGKFAKDISADKDFMWQCGVQGVVVSNLPTGAGLSSSHAFVLCILNALADANDIPLHGRDGLDEVLVAQKVEHSVGVKSGLLDHGSMIYGTCGQLLHARFYDLEVSQIPSTIRRAFWPEDATIVVINSKVTRKLACKDSAIKYALPRLGCALALPILRAKAEQEGVQSDVSQWGLETTIRLLGSLPAASTLDALLDSFPEHQVNMLAAVERLIPGGRSELGSEEVPLRGSTLFVLAECARAREFFKAFQAADLEPCGKLMTVGHQGDDPQGDLTVTDENLASFAKGGDLALVPGVFKAGHVKLDELCEFLLQHRALGASLTGAGMGGCVVGLFSKRSEAETAVSDALTTLNLDEEDIFIATSVAGRGYFDLVQIGD